MAWYEVVLGAFSSILASMGIKAGALFTGIIGGFCSLNFFEDLTPKKRWITAASGAVIGIFGSSLISEGLHLEYPNIALRALERIEVGMALFLALFGMSIAAAFIKAVPEYITAVRTKFFGGGQ